MGGFCYHYSHSSDTICNIKLIFEPTHDKINISPVCSEASLCALWLAKDLMFLHADSEESDQSWRMPSLI